MAQTFSFKCFAEGEFRWIKLAPNKTCTLRSSVDDRIFPPVIIKTNSLGLRNPEITPKPSGTKRILFLGDSFTMGWGVDEKSAYPRLTETLLNSVGLTNHIESINAGVAASGPSGYWLFLKHYALQTEPDVVVIGFYIGDDVTSRRDVEYMKVDAEGLPELARAKSMYVDSTGQLRLRKLPIQYGIPYLRESHLYIFLMKRILGYFPPDPSADPVMTALLCQFKSWCHNLDHEKNDVKKIFLGMKRFTDAHNIRLLVALIPIEFQVNINMRRKFGLQVPLLPAEQHYPDTEWNTFFTQNGIDSVDLLPEFDKHPDTRFYYLYDDHWNPQGQAFAAEVISNKLKDYFTSK